MQRQIIADYDDVGIFVYQAFQPRTVQAALAQGTFADGFQFDRMTWIKPSFGWMLYRSHFASATGQERILRIKLPHGYFEQVLRAAVLSSHDRRSFAGKREWQAALKASPVRCQWDPDRDWRIGKLDRRAIQLGISGGFVRTYVASVMSLEDVTPLARTCHDLALRGVAAPPAIYPRERVYELPADIVERLGITNA